MSQCLVTGATGFLGRHLVARLLEERMAVRCAVRDPAAARKLFGEGVELVQIEDIGSSTDWSEAVRGVREVFHLAGRAHILEKEGADAAAEFLRVNAHGTGQLARSAASAGVRRFVFVSSIKVNGESSGARPYRVHDPPAPLDPYGVSKQEAERLLREVARDAGMEGVIVRPPLVYGPGVGANFLRLLRLVDRGVPLPLGAVLNRRSLVSTWNLCDLLIRCAQAPEAINHTFMVSDGHDLSTADLVRELAGALQRPVRLLEVPVPLLRFAATVTGQMAQFTRLCSSLTVDMSETMRILKWKPPYSVEDSLAKTVAWYRELR